MSRIPYHANKPLPTKQELIEISKDVHKQSSAYLKRAKQVRSIKPSKDFRCRKNGQ
jgi:hypothetical protein